MRKNVWKTPLTMLILLAVFLLLLNPNYIPFLSDETREAVNVAMQTTFGQASGAATSLNSNIAKILNIAAVIILVTLVSIILKFIIENFTPKKNRSQTVSGLLLSIIKYASWLIVIIWSFSVAGVNMAGIFASLGILSLVIGFGAQSLIEDIITGIFIIFEGQYNIGDIIILDDFRGVVRKIGVRTTVIEDAGGNYKIVNNSDIRNLQNRSQNYSVAICDVGISYDERIEKVEKLFETLLPQMAENHKELFKKGPLYVGVQSLSDSAVIMRIAVYVAEDDIFAAQRTLNRDIKIAFDDNNIEIPFTQVVLHQGDKAQAEAVLNASSQK